MGLGPEGTCGEPRPDAGAVTADALFSALDPGFAPAKVNLALHVTGRRADGYHLLDSLVVFAGVGDRVEARPSGSLTLAVGGPLAGGVPVEGNLVLRAARALAEARGMEAGAALRLDKALPTASGLGGGSSDAAAAIRVLSALWGVAPLGAGEALALGADLPVCLAASPTRMRGVGERVEAAPRLPPMALALVNPGAPVATPAVFAALGGACGEPMGPVPAGLSYDGLARWLAGRANHLAAPRRAGGAAHRPGAGAAARGARRRSRAGVGLGRHLLRALPRSPSGRARLRGPERRRARLVGARGARPGVRRPVSRA